jgi:hypothetical protein
MKLFFTQDEVERWRDRVHRRRERLAVRTKQDAVRFVNEVGFCFAFRAEDSELPSLWQAVCGHRTNGEPRRYLGDPFLSFVWKMKRVLPAEGKVFYGRVVKKRPTMISREFLPFFYALSQRTGAKDEYLREYQEGHLSHTAKAIMDSLSSSSPQMTRSLRLDVSSNADSGKDFDKAMVELQTRFYMAKVGESYDPFTFVWSTMARAYPGEVRKARKISVEMARRKLLSKYFENQLLASVHGIRRVFGWKKQVIYEVLGQLMREGIIAGGAKLDGNDAKYYILIR